MELRLEEEPIGHLRQHAQIPISFTVERVLKVSTPKAGLGGLVLREVAVASPWVKDYDTVEGEGPTRWLEQFDTTNWGLVAAYDETGRVGGAVIAHRAPDVWMLEGRSDMAALWDLRVRPDLRSSGIGSALFRATEEWCRERRCRVLKVETQNVNVRACRFYARMGCTLGSINQRAYPDVPDETQLLWFKDL